MKGILTLGLALVFSAISTATTTESGVPVRVAAASIGITPESVAAAGLHTSVAVLLQRVVDADEVRTTLQEAQQSLVLKSVDAQAKRAALTRNPTDEQLQSEYQAAATLHETAILALASAREQLLNLTIVGLTTEQAAVLASWRESEGRRVPLELRVVHRTTSQWDDLEEALVAEARAASVGESLSNEFASLLSQVRSETSVAQAAVNLQAHLTAVRSVFDQLAPE